MRKIILASLVAAALAPIAAQAQTPYQDRRDVIDDRRQIRDDRQQIRDDRRDMRDDWRGYRRDHPEYYRIGGWNGPRGYGYRPVAVGYRFRPEFYDRRYWIDPYRFHLRPVGYGQRWVRYGNDVLLVDVRSGRVLEVNGGFFY